MFSRVTLPPIPSLSDPKFSLGTCCTNWLSVECSVFATSVYSERILNSGHTKKRRENLHYRWSGRWTPSPLLWEGERKEIPSNDGTRGVLQSLQQHIMGLATLRSQDAITKKVISSVITRLNNFPNRMLSDIIPSPALHFHISSLLSQFWLYVWKVRLNSSDLVITCYSVFSRRILKHTTQMTGAMLHWSVGKKMSVD